MKTCLTVLLVLIMSVQANALYLYDDFSYSGNSGKWIKTEYNDGQARTGDETARVGTASWAYGLTGVAYLDNESGWGADWSRLDAAVSFSIGGPSTFTMRWWQRWAENPTWGLMGGAGLLDSTGATAQTTGAEPVIGGHAGSPKAPWDPTSKWRSYMWDWHHESSWQYDTYDANNAGVTMELVVSTSDVTFSSWTNEDWSGTAAYTYSTGAGVASGTYTPCLYIWDPQNPVGEKGGVVAFDNVQFIPEPTTVALLGLGVLGLIKRKKK